MGDNAPTRHPRLTNKKSGMGYLFLLLFIGWETHHWRGQFHFMSIVNIGIVGQLGPVDHPILQTIGNTIGCVPKHDSEILLLKTSYT